MNRHLEEMLRALDGRVSALLARQITQETDSRFGGFMNADFHVEPRQSGFILSELVIAYITAGSRFYHADALKAAMERTLVYMAAHQREDGCFDLSSCNFDSAPDTAFMLNAILNAWWLLEKCEDAEADFLREPLYRLIDSCSGGIASGGFHTPNHRWAIASCLLSCEKITHNSRLGKRARQYLGEGLDINRDGEFSERSAGNYNQVNDDQMIRLYLATGERVYLEAARANLKMMYSYFDPDETVFTNNSTRQDMGQKVYADSYYIFYLLTGSLLDDAELCRMAGWIWRSCEKRGTVPNGVEWALLFPEMDDRSEDTGFQPAIAHIDRLFPESDIARIREGNWSCSLLKGKANCLYFQHGSFSMYMTIYANLCDRRNFLADTLEKTSKGYVMRSHASGWYYEPYDHKPATSDWWQMDSAHTRKKTERSHLDTLFEVVKREDGIDLNISTEGIDGLPVRLEFSFLPGGYVRTAHFLQRTEPGACINVLNGTVEACGPGGEAIALDGAFGAHDVRDRMGGAYPLSENHYTVLFTAYTPLRKTISIRAASPDMRLRG